MSLSCPQCSYVNPDQSSFCVKCGYRFQTTGTVGPTVISTSLPTYPAANSAPFTPPSYSPPTGPGYSVPSQPFLTAPSWTSTAAAPPPPPAQMGTGQGLASLRRAFAGQGALIMHHSWLLDGKQVQAISVLTAIKDMLAQRNYAGLNTRPERLMERGLMTEQRDYLTVNRGVSTVFIYVAPAGNDLYISRATTALPAISNVRITLFSLLGLLMLIGFIARPSPQSLLGGDVFSFFISVILSFASVPILLFFLFLAVRSFIYWLFERDFWVYLRPSSLNDFQLDDIALLEHSTDRVVRDAVEQLGLDANKIVPPAQGYQPKRRIRAI